MTSVWVDGEEFVQLPPPRRDPFPDLVDADPADLDLLRPTDLRLWRALVRLRVHDAAPADDWFYADLRDLAARARIRSYSTAKTALRRLRRAGLVATRRTQSIRWVREGRVVDTTNALEQNLYLVPGECRSRRGVHRLRVPRPQWEEFVAAGGKSVIKPWSTDSTVGDFFRVWQQELRDARTFGHGFPNDCEGLPMKRCPSVIYSREEEEENRTSEKAPLRGESFSLSEKNKISHNEVGPDALDALVELAGSEDETDAKVGQIPVVVHRTGSTLLGCRGRTLPFDARPADGRPCPYITPDPAEWTEVVVFWCSAGMGDYAWVSTLLDCYRAAVRKVYGQAWKQYLKGDLKKARGYAQLLACAREMADHGVAPEYWAEWRLKWFREQPRFKDRPPPVWLVMSAKFVSERAGWYRKECTVPRPMRVFNRGTHEQYLRNEEAAQRWRGLDTDAALMWLPRWYVDKRREEIRNGLEEPHDAWPGKNRGQVHRDEHGRVSLRRWWGLD